jgi:ATP-dependent protease HslVU (ClpYQ) peptidase subunit
MTVCIAVRSQGILLLASDRMLTAGDIQFEPRSQKVHFATTSVVIMYSGDSDFHSEILQDLTIEVQSRVTKEPDKWLNIKDVSQLYLKYRNEAKLRRSESSILAPLNLDRDKFILVQDTMNSEVVNRISEDLINFPVPELDVIIAGIDLRFGHPLPSIYLIRDGDMTCADSVGFAAIGSGARHAESQLMLARHNYDTPNSEALLTLFTGKKDSEIAPGVGAETDMWALGPNVGQRFYIEGPLLKKIEDEYKRLKSKEAKAREKARAEVARYVEEITTTAAKVQAEPIAHGGKAGNGADNENPDQ